MADDIIRCAACGQANRVPPVASGRKAVCGKCKAPLEAAVGPVVVTDATLPNLIAGTRPVVVDFWAAWCGPCRAIAPVVESLAAEWSDVTFAKLNVDENQRTSARFQVSSIPTLVFFRNGKEAGRVVGAVGKPQLEAAIRQYFG